MQSCWMENPLMRPTFYDITKQIKYLLREIKVCFICLFVRRFSMLLKHSKLVLFISCPMILL